MTKKLAIIMIFLGFLIAGGLFAQSFEGVYQLEIENGNGQVISKGTGFYIKPESSVKSYVLTSFHLINARLLEAAKIKMSLQGKDSYLKIAAYDELNDILVLYSEELNEQPWSFGKDCNGKINVTGFHDNKLLAVETEEGLVATEVDAVKRLPVYLSKGFSGAPLFNDRAEVCGMVVLSSENNASSIAVSNEMLRSAINSATKQLYSVRELRIMIGAEKIVHNQEELDGLALDSNAGRQFVVGLAPMNKAQRFIVKNASNIIIDAYSDVGKLLIHQSKNVMVRNVKVERLMINESSDVTVTGCIFNTVSEALLLKGSSNLYVKGNIFRNIETGIVLKASNVDEKTLNADNVFVSVQNTIKNI